VRRGTLNQIKEKAGVSLWGERRLQQAGIERGMLHFPISGSAIGITIRGLLLAAVNRIPDQQTDVDAREVRFDRLAQTDGLDGEVGGGFLTSGWLRLPFTAEGGAGSDSPYIPAPSEHFP